MLLTLPTSGFNVVGDGCLGVCVVKQLDHI